MTNNRFDGEIAIVTGSTSGIGVSTAARLAGEGARVVVTGRREPEGEAVAEEIRAAGGRAVFVRADLAAPRGAADLVATTVEHFGPPTVLVNNAAPTDLVGPGRIDGRLTDVDDEALDSLMQIGFMAAYRCCFHTIPHMQRAGRGAIVNVSSIAGVMASPRVFGYAVAKGALQALTRSVAVDYASEGIRANTVVVGFVVTNPLARRWAEDPGVNAALRRTHLTRFGEPDDIAGAISFLASADAAFVSGTDLYADGGNSVKNAVPGTKDDARSATGSP